MYIHIHVVLPVYTRDIIPGGPFWSKDNPLLNILPAWEHHLADLVSFSLRQHGTGIWRLDTDTGSLEMVAQLAGCGDTAFPSIVRYEEKMSRKLFISSVVSQLYFKFTILRSQCRH